MVVIFDDNDAMFRIYNVDLKQHTIINWKEGKKLNSDFILEVSRNDNEGCFSWAWLTGITCVIFFSEDFNWPFFYLRRERWFETFPWFVYDNQSSILDTDGCLKWDELFTKTFVFHQKKKK